MDSIAAGELPQADGISWKYKNSIEFPKTDHELSGHGSPDKNCKNFKTP